MFTGIVRYLATVTSRENNTICIELQKSDQDLKSVKIGDSIAVNGICLTVVAIDQKDESISFSFHILNETRQKTNIDSMHSIHSLNLCNVELSVAMGSRLDGLISTGHIHTTAKVVRIHGEKWVFQLLSKNTDRVENLVPKSTIFVNGVALTIVDVIHGIFSVCLIPHTLACTNFSTLRENDMVNIEFDSLGTNVIGALPGALHALPYIGQYILSDDHAMKLASHQSELTQFKTSPNPHVGCVIVSNATQQVLGFGHHVRCGGDHAEVAAWKHYSGNGGTDLANCTVYVTLEPCNHYGRTPPCTDFLIGKRAKRIVVGMLDPDAKVSGTGVAKLQDAGIKVKLMDQSESIQQSLRSYIVHRTMHVPYIILKLAISLNGKTCGPQRYLSSEAARCDVHKTRDSIDLILTSFDTIRDDKPKFTVRLNDTDTHDIKHPPVACITRAALSRERQNEWLEFMARECQMENSQVMDQFSLESLHSLAQMGVTRALVEAGATMFKGFYKSGWWNEVHLYVDSKVIGGDQYKGMDESLNLGKISKCETFDSTVKLIYYK